MKECLFSFDVFVTKTAREEVDGQSDEYGDANIDEDLTHRK